MQVTYRLGCVSQETVNRKHADGRRRRPEQRQAMHCAPQQQRSGKGRAGHWGRPVEEEGKSMYKSIVCAAIRKQCEQCCWLTGKGFH